MNDIRLLAIDLDGTLVGPTNEYFLCTEFRDKIEQFQSRTGAEWAICTGRARSGFRSQFKPMLELGIRPNFIVTRDAYIFTVTPRLLFLPFLRWNLHIRRQLANHNLTVKLALSEWQDFLNSWDFGVVKSVRSKRRLTFHFGSAATAEKAFDMLRAKAARHAYIQVQRYGDVVSVEAAMFSKGLAVNEIAASIGVRADQILAVGDGRNDLSMMHSNVAKMTGCPRNAKPEVLEAVHREGGHIAKNRNLAGVIEILDAYMAGTVCSDLPSEWTPPGLHSASEPMDSPGALQRRFALAFVWIFLALAILTFIVFADLGSCSHRKSESPAASRVIK